MQVTCVMLLLRVSPCPFGFPELPRHRACSQITYLQPKQALETERPKHTHRHDLALEHTSWISSLASPKHVRVLVVLPRKRARCIRSMGGEAKRARFTLLITPLTAKTSQSAPRSPRDSSPRPPVVPIVLYMYVPPPPRVWGPSPRCSGAAQLLPILGVD
jgi:hypothetical protein